MCRNGLTYHDTVFSPVILAFPLLNSFVKVFSAIILAFPLLNSFVKFQRGSPTGTLNTRGLCKFRGFLSNHPHSSRNKGCHKRFILMKNYPPRWSLCLQWLQLPCSGPLIHVAAAAKGVTNIPPRKNCPHEKLPYPALKFMPPAAVTTTGVLDASSWWETRPPVYLLSLLFVWCWHAICLR